jgi:hypothetical protein
VESIPWEMFASDGGTVVLLGVLGYRWLQAIAGKLDKIELGLVNVEARLSVMEAFQGLPISRPEPTSPIASAVCAPEPPEPPDSAA